MLKFEKKQLLKQTSVTIHKATFTVLTVSQWSVGRGEPVGACVVCVLECLLVQDNVRVCFLITTHRRSSSRAHLEI